MFTSLILLCLVGAQVNTVESEPLIFVIFQWVWLSYVLAVLIVIKHSYYSPSLVCLLIMNSENKGHFSMPPSLLM